ncbi:MAG: hypothetical protein ABIB11_06185 [Candidatus Omnitrophota bacterium]
MGMPPRHGHGGVSRIPVNVQQGQIQPKTPQQNQPRIQTPQVIPVDLINSFYANLPKPGLQQVSYANEAPYNEADFQPGQNGFSAASIKAPEQFVLVVTDFNFYAITPGSGLGTPPRQLSSYQLVGLLYCDLRIGDRSPMRIDTISVSPYAAATSTTTLITGWPYIDTSFGAQRMDIFALYVRSTQYFSVWYRPVGNGHVARFAIRKLGWRMDGFIIPETDFEAIFDEATRYKSPVGAKGY